MTEQLPTDVRRLVIAGRKVAYSTETSPEIRELDQSLEAFSNRVPWDEEPEYEQEKE